MIKKTVYEMIPTWKKTEIDFMDHNIKDADSIKRILKDVFKDRPEQEHLIVLHLDANCEIKGFEKVFVGNLVSSVATAREVFRSAIACGDFAIALAHNHPGGNLTPSQADLMSTRALCSVGHAVGIPVVEHFICDSEMELTPLKLTDKYLSMFHSKIKFKEEEKDDDDLIPLNEHPSETFVTKKDVEMTEEESTNVTFFEVSCTWVGNAGPDDYKDFYATVIFSQEYPREEITKMVEDCISGCVDDCYTVEDATVKFNKELENLITNFINFGIKVENYYVKEKVEKIEEVVEGTFDDEEIVLTSTNPQDICKQISTMEKFSDFFSSTPSSSGTWIVNEPETVTNFDDEYDDCRDYGDNYISIKCSTIMKETVVKSTAFIFDFNESEDTTLCIDFTVYYDDAGNVYMIRFHED